MDSHHRDLHVLTHPFPQRRSSDLATTSGLPCRPTSPSCPAGAALKVPATARPTCACSRCTRPGATPPASTWAMPTPTSPTAPLTGSTPTSPPSTTSPPLPTTRQFSPPPPTTPPPPCCPHPPISTPTP